MRPRFVLLAAASLLCLAAFLVFGHEQKVSRTEWPPGEAAKIVPSAEPGSKGESTATAEGQSPAAGRSDSLSDPRAEVTVPPTGLHGLIHDEDGRAIAGAWVSWTPRSLSEEHSMRAGVGLREILDGSLRVESDPGGRFEFGARSEQEDGVVWVTAPGRLAAWRAVSDGTASPLVFALMPGVDQEVLVTRAGGGSVLGAEVLQGGEHGAFPKSGLLSDEDVAMELYVRSASVPASGRVELPGWTGNRRYRAVLGELRSFDQFGSGEPVKLELRDTVRLEGRVVADVPNDVLGGAIVYVLLPNEETGEQQYAFAAGLDSAGRMQASLCPWNPNGGYLFKVEGPGLVPGEARVGYVEVEGLVHFELTCTAASAVTFHFTEEVPGAEGPADVAGVFVFTNWRDPETYMPVSPNQALISDEYGFARVANFPAGTTSFSYWKEGYVEGFINDINTYVPVEEPIEVLMQPGGTLEVRVLKGDAVQLEYAIYYWAEDLTITSAVRAECKANGDGVAALTDLPLGRLWVLAVVEGEPQSAPVLATVVKDVASQVEIELPDAVTGIGQVLDSSTRLPVLDARVEIGVSAAGMISGARDDHGEPVDSNGRFELPLFAPGIADITIRAPGYSPLPALGDVGEDGRIDFGTLYITKMQPFTVRCISDQPVDWTQYYGQTGGMTWGPQVPLNADGTYVAEYGRFGENSFTLSTPEGSSIKRSWTLFGEGPWYREVHLTGDTRLEVSFKPADVSLPAYLGLEETLDTDIANAVYVAVDQDLAKGVFSAVDAGAYSLIAYDADWKAVACASVEVTRGQLNEVALELDGSRSFVRMLGKDGTPLSGATVTLRDPDHMPNLLARSLVADDAGLVELPATNLDELMLSAYFPSGGFMATRRIMRPKTDEPLDIVWDGGKGLHLEVFDGDVPLEGLDVWVHESQSGFPAVTLNVPADGHYERPNVGAGEYFAEAYPSWVWNRRVYFNLDDEGTPVRIEFRRLGELTIQVEGLLGNPAAGVAVSLTSDEFGESVGDWLAEGRVTSDTGLVTDADGVVRIGGLPHGGYSWSAGEQSGSVEVAVGSGSVLEVQLEE